MRRKNLFKLVLLVVLLGWALYQLYPTYRVGSLEKKQKAYLGQLSRLVGMDERQLLSALTVGELEATVSAAGATLPAEARQQARELSGKLITLRSKIDKLEPKALRQGLDLVGGTYLVYEADLRQLARTLARDRDERFSEILDAADKRARAENRDFFDVMVQEFKARNIPLNRYYGRRGQSDDVIIDDLRKEAKDGIARTLEVLRNRIDQFGVSEPVIAPQGDKRIVIELAGVQDIERAKRIINTTALLEFKLVREPDITLSVLQDIDKTVKRMRSKGRVEELAAAAQKDTAKTLPEGKKAQEREIDLSQLFGKTETGDTAKAEAPAESTVVVDQQTFEEYPFFSLLRYVEGTDQISVPEQNVAAIKRILQMPEVQKVIPRDAEFLWGAQPYVSRGQRYHQLYFVKREPELVGAYLKTADVAFGGGESSVRAGQAEVHFELNSEGAKIFRRVTGANVGRFLAIVLDGKVYSAPRIKERIPGGSGRIEGSFTREEARDLAVVLRAGALPAPVEVIEERTVGPSLGQDSIEKGKLSAIIGAALAVVFMIVYYRMSGVIANVALALNIFFLIAALAGLRATLTLPGVAGIVLTVGMAVDANVLIFERIREELRTGKTIRAAIDAGYSRAFRTILDSNVTTLITAVVLYQFGSGPVRGFATTLSIGLVINMYTAIVVTRMIFDYVTERYALTKLSI
ncbi:MAG: protein translocase subunit SecD [bacterium]|jgi:preprotein translocase subunit SecD|nr:protein translocase subunit SecD [candidate division KSB1 bacterium]MDH7559667.1 protein translocase subunit SecD [bacterium]